LSTYWDNGRVKFFWANTFERLLFYVRSNINTPVQVSLAKWVEDLSAKDKEFAKTSFGRSPDIYLVDTILRGLVFLLCQYIEYHFAPFSLSDGIYGSVFFMATGLHGLHVMVGLSALWCCLVVRLLSYEAGVLYWNHLIGFTGAIWYWHFVDIVWLFLFAMVYWWAGY